ncbi:restriction endonuclease subunit S [Glaesserella parasuis]|nr:restriction endonuclease subunit S [Glaesserella parasuis]
MKEKALPEGWVETTLADVVKIVRGVSYKKEQSSNEPLENYLPILRASNIKDEYLNFDELVYVQSELIKAEQKIKKNDVLVAMSSGSKLVVGKTARAEQNIEMGFGVFCAILRPNTDIEPKLVSQFTQSAYYRSEISRLSAGGTINNLKPAYFKEIIFPLPPLETQQKLAKKFTALLSQVAEIKQRLEKIPVLLKTYRQSVLARAVNGELTNNGILFSKCKLKDIFTFIDGDRSSNYPKKEEYLSEGHCLFLSTKNVRPYGFDFSEQIYISKEKDEILRKGKLERGDLIITTRGTLGNVAIYDDTVKFEHIRINSGMLILRLQNQKFQNEYFKILIASPVFQSLILEKQTGSAQPQLPAGILKEFEVPIPNIEQQKQITQAVEKHLNFANQLEAQVNAALERINLMTQAILAKGFRGELL